MMHFIARGGGYFAVVSAPNLVRAGDLVIELFRDAGLKLVSMDVMEFDPAQAGGVLLGPSGEELKCIPERVDPKKN